MPSEFNGNKVSRIGVQLQEVSAPPARGIKNSQFQNYAAIYQVLQGAAGTAGVEARGRQ